MSLYSSFYASLSGLSANGNALGVIGNNLANLNTIGYKGSSSTFQDLFSTAMGANSTQGNGNPIQLGLGTRLGAVFQNFGQGSNQATSNATDMAIQGNGFFVLQDASGARLYSRAGNFTLDNAGNLVDPNGYQVIGWNRTAAGTVNTTLPPSPIVIPTGITSPARATVDFGFVTNLNASAAVGDTFTSPNQVYDSLGTSHSVIVTYTKTAANTWTWATTTDDAGATLTGGTGTLTFDASGQLLTPATNPAINIAWSNGSAAQALTFDIYSGNPPISNLTQYAAASSTSNSFQDGTGAGTIRSVSVSTDGTVVGSFTNGQTIPLARVSLALFANINGLQKEGNNTWSETIASGVASTGAASEGGRGTVLGANLELSNVDVAAEFTQLIINQRGYQANSRVVTTSDELLQETLNLKR